MLTPEQNEDLQAMAESLVAKIDSAEPNISPTEFQEIFANEARKSDQSFRAKYGNISWMMHHIEAHHLANPQPRIGNRSVFPNINNFHVPLM